MTKNTLNKHAYFQNIDALRGVAIILVLIVHSTLNSGIYAKYFNMFASFGSFGVDLFFVISGFLITTILLNSKESPNYFKNFYARRMLRIFPLYYGFIVLYLFILPLVIQDSSLEYIQHLREHQLYYWFYIPNILFSLHPEKIHFFHLWSLAVEEQYYIIWPVIVFFFNPKSLIKLLLIVIPLSFFLRCFFVFKGYNQFFIWSFTPIRLEAIAIGSLVAIIYVHKASFVHKVLVHINNLIIIFSTIIILALLYNKGLYWNTPSVQTLGILFIDIFFGLLVLKIISMPDFKESFFKSLFQTFGKYCYAIYMLHEVFLHRIADKVKLLDIGFGTYDSYIKIVIILIITSVFSCGVAFVSWNVYEKHFLKLKQYFN